MSAMWFVYLDWTLEAKPRCFYVGKGSQERVSQVPRNKKHVSVTSQYGIRREVVFKTRVQSKAFEKERALIRKHKTLSRSSEIGCNLTLGGWGTAGYKHTAEERERRRQKQFGVCRPHTEATKLKMSLAKKGRAPNNKGKQLSLETRAKMSASRRGKLKSEEWKRLMSERMKGNKNGLGNVPWNKGKKKESA